jgi:CRP/FNR family transcriptional regulator, cyclic AMP receptor protein
MRYITNGSSSACDDCGRRAEGFFCNLPPEAFAVLKSIKVSHAYPRGSTLFMEGQPANGVFLLCEGHVKLSTYSEDGKAIILRIAEPGEVLGVSSVISGKAHEATGEVTDYCRVSFVKRSDFLSFVQTSHEAALNALRQLSSNYYKAHMQICSLGLSSSAGDKLAKLLLQWCDLNIEDGTGRTVIPLVHTHGEIAEMIGTSRETVTRLLKDFKTRNLLTLTRNELCIPDKRALKASIGTRHRTA